MAFSHQFHPTSLREYDIRGVVGKTLTPEDGFAIGRTFGSMIARTGGSIVAVGYDGRTHSPDLEKALVEGLKASGMNVLRVGRGPTPLLYFAAFTRGTDGAVMVTGSHNPPEYNGFKMMVGKKPFYGKDILELGRLSAAGEVVAETTGHEEMVDFRDDYVARLARDWDGGDQKLKIVWDNGNGAAGEVLQKLLTHIPGEHKVL